MIRKLSVGLLILVLSGISVFGENTLAVYIEGGENWYSRMKIAFISVKKTPQIAVWVETEDGRFVDTLMVTGRAAKQNWRAAPDGGRPEALPVWTHAASRGEFPLDAASSATPDKDAESSRSIRDLVSGKTYVVRAEINQSFDYNEYWGKDEKEDSPRYSGVNGQPSVVYSGLITNTPGGEASLSFLGQGSVDGTNGTIVENADGLTTALTIIREIRITVEGEYQ